MDKTNEEKPVELRQKTRGGRPTKEAVVQRDERLLEIAAQMFMEQGFDRTSMERLAETAMIGKATLYARYADKGALFADVLRRRILLTYGPFEGNPKRA
jgi:AcrR family transcriptional regulator